MTTTTGGKSNREGMNVQNLTNTEQLLSKHKGRNIQVTRTASTVPTTRKIDNKGPIGILRKKLSPLGQLPFPIVKITISPDSPDQEVMTDRHQQQCELKRLMDTFIHAATTPCSCASNLRVIEQSDRDVEVSWEDLARRCTDFGISDFLSVSMDQIDDFEVTDNFTDALQDFDGEGIHWLCTSPPLRLSDPDIDNIDPIPVTLDTILNLYPEVSTLDTPRVSSIENEVIESEVFEVDICESVIRATGGEIEDEVTQGTGIEYSQEQIISPSLSQENIGIKIKKYPPKPFRRHISLPPKLFAELYLRTEGKNNNNVNYQLNKQQSLSESHNGRFLNQLNTDPISGDSEEPYNNSDSSLYNLVRGHFQNRRCISINSSWETSFSRSDFNDDVTETQSKESSTEKLDMEEYPFMSSLEKRAIHIRNVRRLIRQDTVGNFAPPDFCI